MSINIRILEDIFAVKGFSWNLVAQCKVVSRVLTERQQFDKLWHRWYLTDGRTIADWNSPGARPVSVLQLAADEHLVNYDSRIKIVRMRCIMGQLDPPLRERILTYALPGGAELVLAGNHRAAAIASKYCKLAMRVSVTTIVGPIDGNILPELWHFSRQGVPPELLQKPAPTESISQSE